MLWLDSTRVGSEGPETTLQRVASDRLKVALLAVGWAYHASWVLFNPSAMDFIVGVEGPIIGPIKYFAFTPLVYYVIAVDFSSVYLGVLLLLPLKLRATGFINFQDPLGYGQLKPVGDLIKSGTLYYFLAVTVYVLLMGFSAIFARSGAPIPGVRVVSRLGTGVAIVAGIALFVLPIIVIHGHMKHAKHEKIQQLATEVEDRGPETDEMMFPETSIPESVEEGHEYIQYFIKITKVENTHEYPIDVSHLQEIVLAALVPYIAHVTVTFLLSYSASGAGH